MEKAAGFIHASGTKIIDGAGKEVFLAGWGLGNWLLCEGYMWGVFDNPLFDRPRRIEAVLRELAGSAYVEGFWPAFRANYITKADIARLAALGYNSVRVPFNWRLFMAEEPDEISFLDGPGSGFDLLDRCLDWCEEYGVYAFLDMHGAPGGQTGHNIDDSRDNLPRLFIDGDSWQKALALWRRLADRYAARGIVGGYDLLNEPLRTPVEKQGLSDTARYLPRLKQFYREACAAIRSVDRNHLLSIEGHYWATRTEVFDTKYDDNMVIHFHRYFCPAEKAVFEEFCGLSQRLNLPLWLGETGENTTAWFASMCALARELGVGYNLWPWKKLNCTNSPYSIRPPEKWPLLLEFFGGGKKPSKKETIEMLDAFLENMLLTHCGENTELLKAIRAKV